MASFSTKTWVDRISEYPTRRTLTKENGTSEIVTVSRSEGTISKEGDAFSAANMNNLETRINSAITSVNTDITALKKSVSDGKTLVAKAITDKGQATAANASFQTMSDNVRLMAGTQYAAGVTAADNRANPNSTNYRTGYNAGYSAGAAAKKSFTLQIKPEQDNRGYWAIYAYVNGVKKDGWWVGETSNLPNMITDKVTYNI